MRWIVYVLMFYLPSVCAKCTTTGSGGTTTLTVDAINVQRDATVGSIIYATTITPSGASPFSCSAPGIIYYQNNYLQSTVTSFDDVYATSVKGVGVKLYYDYDHNLIFANPPYARQITSNGSISINGFKVNVEFIKTDEVEPGLLTPGLLATVYGDGDTGDTTALSIHLAGEGNINVLKCTLLSRALNFALGDISAGSFTGQGTVTTGQSENAVMDCDTGTNISLTLQATADSDIADNTVIALLDGKSPKPVAEGVGVQLLYNQQPLVIGTPMAIKTSTGGEESIGITARYYQTKPTVKPGRADAIAILDITYQ